MQLLEERLGKARLPTAAAMASATYAPVYVANGTSAASLTETRTNNGTTLSCWLSTSASGGAEVSPPTSEAVNESNLTSAAGLQKQPSAISSQLYM